MTKGGGGDYGSPESNEGSEGPEVMSDWGRMSMHWGDTTSYGSFPASPPVGQQRWELHALILQLFILCVWAFCLPLCLYRVRSWCLWIPGESVRAPWIGAKMLVNHVSPGN